MNIDELLTMNYDDIDYKTLSDDVLKKLALSEEPYIASSALGELLMRKSPLAVPTAWEILSQSHGDRYLQAFALLVLFRMDQNKAVKYMAGQALYCDPYLLNSMMELMIEDEQVFKSEPALSVVRLISKRLKECSSQEKYPETEVRENFFKIFGQSLT